MAKASKAKKSAKAKTLKIRPLGEKVLLQRLEAEEMTRGGIVLPQAAREKPQRGTVLAVGDGKMLDDGTRGAFQVAKGDTVLFASYAGTEIKIDAKEYMLMDESEVLAILD